MGRIHSHLGFGYSRRYAENFWVRNASRDGRWTMAAQIGRDDETGPEAERFAALAPPQPVLRALAAVPLPVERETVGVS